jgi:hypothetical protein
LTSPPSDTTSSAGACVLSFSCCPARQDKKQNRKTTWLLCGFCFPSLNFSHQNPVVQSVIFLRLFLVVCLAAPSWL